MAQTHSLTASSPYPRMSYEEYLDDPTIDEQTEWVDGEVIPIMSVTNKHANMTSYLIGLLGAYTSLRRLGTVYAEPFQMKLAQGRAPDVFFVRGEHMDREREKHIEGPADLVIEVISKGTEAIDRVLKFREYQDGRVPEYWIIDPDREVVEFYLLDENGVFRPAAVPRDGTFESPALDGFGLKVQWLWERPPAIEALRDSRQI